MEPGPCQTGKDGRRQFGASATLGASMEPGPCQTGKRSPGSSTSRRGFGRFNGARSMSDREDAGDIPDLLPPAELQWSPVHVRPGSLRPAHCRAEGIQLQWSPVHVRPGSFGLAMDDGPARGQLQWSPVHVRPGRHARAHRGTQARDASMEPGPCQTGKAPGRSTNVVGAGSCFNGARSMSDREGVLMSMQESITALLQWSPVHVRPGRSSISGRIGEALQLQWSPVHVRPGSRGDRSGLVCGEACHASMEPGPCQTGKARERGSRQGRV